METFSQHALTDCGSVRHSREISDLLTAANTEHSQPEGSVELIAELWDDDKGTQTSVQTKRSQNVPSTQSCLRCPGKEVVASVTNGHSRAPVGTDKCAHAGTDKLAHAGTDKLAHAETDKLAHAGTDSSPADATSDTRYDDEQETMHDVSSDDAVDGSDDDGSLVMHVDEPQTATMTNLHEPRLTKPAPPLTRASSSPRDSSTSSQDDDNANEIPVHCQIRPEFGPRKMTAGTSLGSGPRSLPIHCIVELTSPDAGDCPGSQVMLDTYAILPGATLFSQLVKTSLLRLGYSHGQAVGATGSIQLKNWKALMFAAVTDNLEATVEEILGEITGVATLRIRLSSTQTNSVTSSNPSNDPIKDTLLQLLLTKSIDFLVQAGCPVEKPLLEAISTGDAIQSISDQVCTSFNDWYTNQKIGPCLNDSSAYSTLLKSNRPASSASLPAEVFSGAAMATGLHVSASLATQPSDTKAPSLATQPSDTKVPPLTTPPHLATLSRSSPLNLDIKREQPTAPSDSARKASTDPESQPCNQFVLAHKESVDSAHKNGKLTDPESQRCNQFVLGHKESVDSAHKNRKLTEKHPERNCLQSELFKFSRVSSEGNMPSTLEKHPYLGLMPGKTRIRTSFDPEQEIPRLQKWFSSNQHPTREQMVRFMHELNGLESRKGRRPLDLTNIIYWFKNARAAQRRATRVLDDSFENEENVDMNSAESGNSTTDSVPPFLPNKNAVYMIPFHPYPHLVSGTGACDGSNLISGVDIDEPYDLSLSKRTASDLAKTRNGKVRDENHFLSLSTSPSPTKSSSTSSECEGQGSLLKKKKAYCPPRFPALLDVACKMRQEIPLRSEDIYFNNSSNHNSSNHNSSNHNGCRGSPYRSGSGSSVMEHSSKNEDMDSNYSNPSTPLENGDCGVDKFSSDLKIKEEDGNYSSCHNSRKNYQHSTHTSRDSGLELGQLQKMEEVKADSSDDDDDDDDENTNDSYNSEEELKLRLKQNAAVVDYASAMHNNVSRLTAANMAALSLAQMGQPLHIPQLTSSLAMAYYPMDPRFYSQPTVPHSLTTSPPTSLTNTHPSHLSLRQSHDCPPRLESRSPLPSPSVMQQSLSQLNHHHHHHHHQQHHQQQSPQQHHQRHNSEPRKRRTRVFIDPLTEIPKLEKWFTEDTHPSAFMIDKFCEELNKCEYRHKFPKLEPKNIQLWFKNHRAKVKRLKVSCDEQADQTGANSHIDETEDLESA